jgi:sugar/nucleoside kinase (ribokinase family)
VTQYPDDPSKIDVVCTGILVADIFVPPLPRLPGVGELLATDDFYMDSGGCAANTATCLTRLGFSARVVGKTGSDHFGDFIESDLRSKSIDISGISRSATTGTSKTVVLTVQGEDRRFIHTIGANADFRAEDINPAWLTRTSVFYVGGYLVLPGMTQAGLRQHLQTAREHGVITVLDVVIPADSGQERLADLAELLPYVDYFLPNDGEAAALTGHNQPVEQAQRFLEMGCGTVVITMGAAGLVLGRAGEFWQMPVFPVDMVDGAGAGDACAAGFIVGLLEGRSLEDCMRLSGALGASACTRLGCTTGVFNRAELDAFLSQHADIVPEPVRAG